MERRDTFLLLLALAGGGYATYANWDTIYDTLGLADLAPGKVRAITLAKRANTLHRTRPNWEILDERLRTGEIEMPEDGSGWHSEAIAGERFYVRCNYLEDGEPVSLHFRVDVTKESVEELESPPAAPR